MSENSKHLFAYYLELSRAELSPELLDESAFDELLHIGRQFSADISTFWGFECRLGETQKKADLLFEIKKASSAHALLSNTVNSDRDALMQRSPIWQQLTAFAAHWHDRSHPFNHHVRNIWLEFDVAAVSATDDRDKTLAYPCIFWGPNPHEEITDDFLQQLISVIDSLAQAGISAAQLQSFRSSLPDNAQLFQLGVMTSRQAPIVRVCVNHIAYSDMVPFLKRSNWTGNIGAFSSLIDILKPLVKSIAIDLDIAPAGIGKKIGLECYMDWGCEDADQWLPLLNHLTVHHLLLPEKREGLLKFPKNKTLPLKDQLDDDSTDTVYQLFCQNIHHIKLTFTDGAITEAKAYLGVYRPGLNKRLFTFTEADGKHPLPKDHWITA